MACKALCGIENIAFNPCLPFKHSSHTIISVQTFSSDSFPSHRGHIDYKTQ